MVSSVPSEKTLLGLLNMITGSYFLSNTYNTILFGLVFDDGKTTVEKILEMWTPGDQPVD